MKVAVFAVLALVVVFGRSQAAALSGKLIQETAHFKTLEGDLAWACNGCNRHKGPISPESTRANDVRPR